MEGMIRTYLEESAQSLNRFLSDDEQIQNISRAILAMSQALKAGNKILSCGNGGSMSDAMHFAEELTGRFREDRASLAAIAISDPSYLSCVANDYGYDQIFSRFIEGIGNEGDVLLAISTSGNSKNVLKAMDAAKDKGMTIIGLTGKDGGSMAGSCDVEIRAPRSTYADHAQEIHIKVIHCLIAGIEESIS